MTHDELARCLAGHLRTDTRMTWCDVQLGPSGSPRPDVYAIFKSFLRPCPMAYEVKISLPDFAGDVTSGKWQAYLKYANGVVFAVPANLGISKADVPTHCGLMVYNSTWRVAKKPVLSPVIIPQDALLKLLIDGVQREGPHYRRATWTDSLYGGGRFRQKFGETASKLVHDRLNVENEIEYYRREGLRIVEAARKDADRIRKEETEQVAPLRAELAEALGLEATADRYALRHAVTQLRAAQRCHPAQEKHQRLTAALQNALSIHGWREEKIAADAENPVDLTTPPR